MSVVPKIPINPEASAEELFSSLLASRKLELHPPAPTLDYLLKNSGLVRAKLKQAKSLLTKSLTAGEDILVFGDYDADGITATAIMWLTLMHLARGSKARILPFIPDRHRHGYGLSEKAIADIRSGLAFKQTKYPDFQPSLVITVDNGIVANSAVKSLVDTGVKVIVTDHHQPDRELPPATCILHTTVTSGAGISWITAMYLSDSDEKVAREIDLATVGIVADMMPLAGLNRAIVTAGLRRLSRSLKPGLAALYSLAGLTDKDFTTYDISFGLAPRLNAAGRLADPYDALRLVCTADLNQAKRLASTIESHNRLRQGMLDEALSAVNSKRFAHHLIILSSPSYHEGVVGLIAGKVMESTAKPTLAIAIGPELAKGSARSVPGVDITALLRRHQDLFTSLGGHPAAAGFSLPLKNLPKLEKALYEDADKQIDPALLVKTEHADLEITTAQATLTLARLLHGLEPYGIGNPRPRLLLRDLEVLEDRKVGKTGSHRKLTVEQNGVTRDVIWFNGKAEHPLRTIKELVGYLDINVWRAHENVQLVAQYVGT